MAGPLAGRHRFTRSFTVASRLVTTPPGARGPCSLHARSSKRRECSRPHHVIYVGPLDTRHHVHALADAFMAARDHDHRLHLLVSGVATSAHASSVASATPRRSSTGSGDAQLEQLTGQADLLVVPPPRPTLRRRSWPPSGAAYRYWPLRAADRCDADREWPQWLPSPGRRGRAGRRDPLALPARDTCASGSPPAAVLRPGPARRPARRIMTA